VSFITNILLKIYLSGEVEQEVIVRACSTRGFKGNTWRLFVGVSESKRPPETFRLRRGVDIRVDFIGVVRSFKGSIGLAQDRGKWRSLVNAVKNVRVP
jgi:hypothetical protein